MCSYAIVTINSTGSRHHIIVEADSLKEAMVKATRQIKPGETIDKVYKQVKTWREIVTRT